MIDELSDKLVEAEDLLYRCQFRKVKAIIDKLEKEYEKAPDKYLPILLLKGRLYFYIEKYRKASEIGEMAHKLSSKLNKEIESVDALLIKSHVLFLGKLNQSKQIIEEIDVFFTNNNKQDSSKLKRQYNDFLIMKSIIYRYTDDLEKSEKFINKWLERNKNSAKQLDLSRAYIILGDISLYKNDPEKAIDFFQLSLKIQTQLQNNRGIATSLQYLALGNYYLGNLDLSQTLCKKSLSLSEISVFTTSTSLHLLGVIYKEKGELNRALRIYKRVAKIRDIEQYFEEYLTIILAIGTIYRLQGKYDLAIEYFERCYKECRNINSLYGIGLSLFYLILVNLDKDDVQTAELYLSEFKPVVSETKSESFNNVLLVAEALILKKSNRMRDKSKAEVILKQVVEKEKMQPQLLLLTLANLCDLLLYEMVMMDNMEILNEINPLITRMLNISKIQNSYLWLAETKLLQAKLNLVKMDIRTAKKLMTEAQKIAEMHNLSLLAQRISSDHDSLLDQSDLWDELLGTNAPLSERVKLASVNGVLNRMKGSKLNDPPILKNAEPKLLLIMSKDGIPHFTHSFHDTMDYQPLFSSFLSAFNSFGSELFSESIDRINIGEYKILIDPIENFLFCYVIKGQSFYAKKKLKEFTSKVIESSKIWEALKMSVKTCRMLEMDNPIELGNYVKQIFNSI